MAKSTSANAREELSLGAKSNNNHSFFRATGLGRESSTGSDARENSRPTQDGADAETGSPALLAQPRASRNNGVGAILRRALVLLRRRGWRSTHWERDTGRGLSVFEAIQQAGRAAADCYYAKLTLHAVLGCPFADWESGQWRSEAEVFALLRRAAVVARGDAFAAHAGGWRVSSGAPRVDKTNVQSIKQRRGVR